MILFNLHTGSMWTDKAFHLKIRKQGLMEIKQLAPDCVTSKHHSWGVYPGWPDVAPFVCSCAFLRLTLPCSPEARVRNHPKCVSNYDHWSHLAVMTGSVCFKGNVHALWKETSGAVESVLWRRFKAPLNPGPSVLICWRFSQAQIWEFS